MRRLPLLGQILRKSPLGTAYAHSHSDEPVVEVDEATVITSEVAGNPGRHRVVLDIDLPGSMVESSTPGHHHLFLDKVMSWDDFQRLLWVMTDLGLVEEGYASASTKRGYTAVRLPWIGKEPTQ